MLWTPPEYTVYSNLLSNALNLLDIMYVASKCLFKTLLQVSDFQTMESLKC